MRSSYNQNCSGGHSFLGLESGHVVASRNNCLRTPLSTGRFLPLFKKAVELPYE